MLTRNIFKRLLGWNGVSVKDAEVDDSKLTVHVRLASPRAFCSGCGCSGGVYDREVRTWRHLDAGGVTWRISYALRRVKCRRCGVRVEQVPWAEVGAWHTKDFEDQVAFLAQQSSKSAVVEQMGIGWLTVGAIINRVMARCGPKDRLVGLTHIGVDELSVSGNKKYITLVYDHARRGVVWAGEGKSKETLAKFFAELGAERSKLIQVVTMDMSEAYVQAVRTAVPQAVVIFDRFHVQRLAHDALDEVRRAEVRDAGGARNAPDLKGLRWTLHKNPWNLHVDEKEKLTQLPRRNQRLYRAYLLKEALAGILDGRQWRVAERRLVEWISWAKRSRLLPFKRLALTIESHLEGILAYVRTGLNNGLAEGLNGKTRVITKRSYGFHNAANLIAMIFLCCSGLVLQSVHKTPVPA